MCFPGASWFLARAPYPSEHQAKGYDHVQSRTPQRPRPKLDFVRHHGKQSTIQYVILVRA